MKIAIIGAGNVGGALATARAFTVPSVMTATALIASAKRPRHETKG